MDDAALAARAQIPIDVLRAIRAIESGSPRAVRFEDHVFNRLTGDRFATRIAADSHTRTAFEIARAFDAANAVRATSWGSYQVLGGHLLRLYGTPDAAVAAFDAAPQAVSEQLLISWFESNPRAAAAARAHDIATLGAEYNGSTRWVERVTAALADADSPLLGLELGLGGAASFFRWLTS